MGNARPDEVQAGINIAGRNINNLRYTDDTTHMAEIEEEVKSFLLKVKEESEKVGLKLNIQKTNIMASRPINSWQIDGETMETVRGFIFLGSKITADGDCNNIKRRLLLGRKAMTNFSSVAQSCLTLCNPMNCSTPGLPVHHQLPAFTQTHVHRVGDAIQPSHPLTYLDSILKSRDITLPTNVCLVKAMVFPVVIYGCESWTIKKAECQRIDAFERWCWRRLLRVPWTARRSNQSILKEINPEYSLEGRMLKLKV